MIFVYPAIVSDNVDKKIAPIVCKMLEQFYLMHIAESFQGGSLRVKTIFNQNRKVYGPLVLENKKTVGKIFLSESEKVVDITPETIDRNARNFIRLLNTRVASKFGGYGLPNELINDPEFINKIKNDEEAKSEYSKFSAVHKKVTADLTELRNHKTLVSTSISDLDQQKDNSDPYGELKRDKEDLNNIEESLIDYEKRLTAMMGEISKRFHITSKEKDSKFEYEKGKETAQQYETHGTYKVEIMKGVSFKPTMMNISVKIHYLGGPHENYGGVSPSGSMQEIAIGCKILPMSLKSFESIEEAVLSDYFATKYQMAWRIWYRGFLRSSIRFVEKALKWLGIHSDLLAGQDPINSNILLAPSGYINASSFKNKSGTPGFYNYSSAIVIFNKDDIIKEEGENFFLDRVQLMKMFKAGWNAFCILDPHREEAMFITALDGGYLHTVPYSYIFNALGMDQIYTNLNDLQRRSPVFRLHTGKFSALVSKLRKESAMLFTARKFIKSENVNGNKK